MEDQDPVVSILEEIDEQANVGGGGWLTSILNGPIYCGLSYLGGNKGHVCTLTVECQNNCS